MGKFSIGSGKSEIRQTEVVTIKETIEKPVFEVRERHEVIEKPVFEVKIASQEVPKPRYVEVEKLYEVVRPQIRVIEMEETVARPVYRVVDETFEVNKWMPSRAPSAWLWAMLGLSLVTNLIMAIAR